MSREIPDRLSPRERLVGAGGVERELADQLSLRVDHADVPVGVLRPLVAVVEDEARE
jgi:hypothetical protein